MIVAIDVMYSDAGAQVGAVAFDDWSAETPSHEWLTTLPSIADYEPGLFYKRELPCLLAALDAMEPPLRESLTCIVVDGYVWLDASDRPGLGAYLYRALDEAIPIIGVAKNEFACNHAAIPLLRGTSQRPLFITAAGLDPQTATHHIAHMHGPFRNPPLLQRADALARLAASPPSTP